MGVCFSSLWPVLLRLIDCTIFHHIQSFPLVELADCHLHFTTATDGVIRGEGALYNQCPCPVKLAHDKIVCMILPFGLLEQLSGH